MNALRILTIVIGVVVAICILGYLVIKILGKIALKPISSLPAPEMPEVPAMPPVVETPMEEILARLEEEMNAKDPNAFEGLLPGLTDEQIASIEQEGGFNIPDDMKALYKWHNGSKEMEGPLPDGRFVPLDEAVAGTAQLRGELEKQPQESRRLLDYMIFWIAIFPDGFGDGYYYDPQRTEQQGNIFYNFAEEGEYVFFPSIKNLLAWALKCYEEGAFPWGRDANQETRLADIEHSRKLRKEFGVEVSE